MLCEVLQEWMRHGDRHYVYIPCCYPSMGYQHSKSCEKLLKVIMRGSKYGVFSSDRSDEQARVTLNLPDALWSCLSLSYFFYPGKEFDPDQRLPQLLCSVRQSPWIHFLCPLTCSRVCTSFTPTPYCLLKVIKRTFWNAFSLNYVYLYCLVP